MRQIVRHAVIAFALLTLSAGCTTYRDQLARGQRAFELNEHDRALAILRDLETDVGRLRPAEQAEYAYLRGMTDYRVGYRADARHWLSLTKAYEDNSPGLLPADWKLRVNEALDDLNNVVYSEGTQSLTTTRRGDDEIGKEPTTKKPGVVDKPSADKPSADKPSADKPSADKPSADKPSDVPKAADTASPSK
jgi:hypothetical protein